MLREEIKQNHIKCSIKTREDRKRGEKRTSKQIENKHGTYEFNHTNDHLSMNVLHAPIKRQGLSE